MTEWANMMTFRQEPTRQPAEKGLFGAFVTRGRCAPHGHPSGNQMLFQNLVNLTRRNDFTKGKVKFIRLLNRQVLYVTH